MASSNSKQQECDRSDRSDRLNRSDSDRRIIEEHVLQAINLDGIQHHSGREFKIFTGLLILIVVTFAVCLIVLAYFL